MRSRESRKHVSPLPTGRCRADPRPGQRRHESLRNGSPSGSRCRSSRASGSITSFRLSAARFAGRKRGSCRIDRPTDFPHRHSDAIRVLPLYTAGAAIASVHPVAVKLDPDIRARIKQLAKVRDRSAHWMMREAILQYVEREEKRESFRRDGMRAWAEYQETGLHLNESEADAWLARLEAGQDEDPPECHG